MRPKGIFYDRRKNYYKNDGKPRDKIIGIPYLAQAVMAIVLRRPDSARARPSSLLKAEDDYKKVFDSSYPINLYYVCAEAMRQIDRFLKSPASNVHSEHRNNLRFYVAMYTVAGVVTWSNPNVVAEFDVDNLNEDDLKSSLDFVQSKYMMLGGNDQVSKGPTLLQALLDNGPLT